MIERDERIWLRTRIRPDITIKIVVLTATVVGLLLWDLFWLDMPWERQVEFNKAVGAVIFISVTGVGFLIWSNGTYTISYDENSVYMGSSPWAWKKLRFIRSESEMRFDDIAELGPGQGEGLSPLAYIAFRREGGEWEEYFFVSRLQLHDIEIREFAQHMHSKIPEKFPPELIEYMEAPSPPY